jgi:hypothetical protein
MRRRWLQPRASLRGSKFQAQNGPPIFQALAQLWGLVDHEERGWWRGLCCATWSTSVAWRERLIAFAPEQPDARRFVEAQCVPAALVAVLEDLVREGAMTRQCASTIEEKILVLVDAHGVWHGSPLVGTDPRGDAHGTQFP